MSTAPPSIMGREGQMPHLMPLGSRRNGVCRGCRADTTLQKVEPRTWRCLDCEFRNEGRFPAAARRRRVVPNRVVDMYRAGAPLRAITAECGITLRALYDKLDRAGVPRRKGRQPKRPALILVHVPDELLARYGELTVAQIADLAGVGHVTVAKRLRDSGIELNRCFFGSGGRDRAGLGRIGRSRAACAAARRALEMEAAGVPWPEIAAAVGYGTAGRLKQLIHDYRAGQLLAQRIGIEPIPNREQAA